MEMFFDLLSPQLWLIALSIAVLGGIVKGVVGFAMPMVVISGLSSIMAHNRQRPGSGQPRFPGKTPQIRALPLDFQSP